MKQKLFTLLTLLVLCVTGAWADDPITVTWLPDGSSSSVTSTAGTASVSDILTVANISASSDVKEGPLSKSYSTGGTHYYGYYTPTTNTNTNGVYSKDDYLTFAVTVKAGYTFTPTNVTLKAIGIGTNAQGAQIFATVQTVNGTNQLGKGDSSNQNPSTLTLNSFSSTSYNGGETLNFYIHFGSKDSNKSVGFRDIVLSGTYAVTDTRDPLTLSFTPDNQTIAVAGNLATSLNWSEDTSSESAKYTTSYSSDDEAIATVNASGVITGVAEGTTTITATVTATGDATYKTTKATITVNVVAPFAWSVNYGVPTGKLDLTDADAASLMLNDTWHADYGRVFLGNDGANNYLTYSVVGAYSSTEKQTWVKAASGSSAGYSWSATGVFKGANAYMATAKAATVSTGDNKYYAFRVKGVSKVQTLAKSNSNSQTVTLAAFELTGNTPAASTVIYGTCGNTESTISIDLNGSKEYVVILVNDGSSNSRLCEMALFYDESVQLYEPIATASGKNYATYVTTNALDFSTVSDDIKAYVAESEAAGTKISFTGKDAVPAKTPILVKTTSAGATVNVPVATSAPGAVGTNKLVAGTGAAISYNAGESHFYYILTNGQFKAANNSVVAVGKAYLSLDAAAAANELTISFDDEDGGVTGIQNLTPALSKGEGAVFDLQGRRVAQPTKGLYIVNGKKVVLK